jgi:hypothetical protein
MLNCEFAIVAAETDDKTVTIRDIGHQTKMSVTNDVENVVAYLYAYGLLRSNERLLYYDSQDRRDEITHDGAGKFTGFVIHPGFNAVDRRLGRD